MSGEMNTVPSGERTHIGFFGRRNAGKSSIVNAVTGQDLAVVSEIGGTTTDPVTKSMELLPLGPVVIIDTPGFDDEGSLGDLRVRKTRQILNRTDIAVLVVDAFTGLSECDEELIRIFEDKRIPWITVFNKSDLLTGASSEVISTDAGATETDGNPIYDSTSSAEDNSIYVSALTGDGINALKEMIAEIRPSAAERRIIADKISAGDMVVLVTPIDKAAPKGRLILPQQQTIRDIIDSGAAALVTRETELEETLKNLGRMPDLVITDSQVFGKVNSIVPHEVPLTSFSILMARRKGLLDAAVRGAAAIDDLRDGDRILIAEGCTHHRQCGDIGTVKIPGWLMNYSGKRLEFSTVSGTEFPDDLTPYALIVHCGGCMLNEREVEYRAKCAEDQGVPITNYGTLIAYVHGILKRSLGIFPELADELQR